MMPVQFTPDVALIGFGEAGLTFAQAGAWRRRARAYDVLASRELAMAELGVTPAATAAEALAGAPLALSLVTADQALPAAQAAAPALAPGALWCDCNSVAPETKRAAGAHVEAAGGRYVDVAVMAPVEPARLAVPLLLAGPGAGRAEAALRALGFTNVRVVGDEVGRASAIKMIRSVMVKGIEALSAECALAGAEAGVLDEVIASLDASGGERGWAQRIDYNLDRMLVHGMRRSAEMREVSKTLAALGIAPMMTEQTVNWQQGIGELGIAPPDGLAAKLATINSARKGLGA